MGKEQGAHGQGLECAPWGTWGWVRDWDGEKGELLAGSHCGGCGVGHHREEGHRGPLWLEKVPVPSPHWQHCWYRSPSSPICSVGLSALCCLSLLLIQEL